MLVALVPFGQKIMQQHDITFQLGAYLIFLRDTRFSPVLVADS